MINRQTFSDARDAIRDANAEASMTKRARVIAYVKGAGWLHYDPVTESVDGEPEFLCMGLGRIPLPIGDHAIDVLYSALRDSNQ